MARYSLVKPQAASGVNLTAGGTLFEIKASATGRCSVVEMGYVHNNTVGTGVGIVRSTTAGSMVNATPGIPESLNDPASFTKGAVAWSVVPVLSSALLRRVSDNTAGTSGFIFLFPRGLKVPSGGSVCVTNVASMAMGSNGRGSFYAVYEE